MNKKNLDTFIRVSKDDYKLLKKAAKKDKRTIKTEAGIAFSERVHKIEVAKDGGK